MNPIMTQLSVESAHQEMLQRLGKAQRIAEARNAGLVHTGPSVWSRLASRVHAMIDPRGYALCQLSQREIVQPAVNEPVAWQEDLAPSMAPAPISLEPRTALPTAIRHDDPRAA